MRHSRTDADLMTLARAVAARLPRFAARLLTVTVTVLCAAALIASPGQAAGPRQVRAPSTQVQQPEPITFAIQPGTKSGPDKRGRFDLRLRPGARYVDWVVVTNFSTRPATLGVYAADAFNTPNGGFDVVAAGVKSRDVGAWTKVERNRVRLAAGKKAIIPFQLRVPRNATPGDHVGGIIASLTTIRRQNDGTAVRVDNRVGTRVYLRVAGPLSPKVTYTVTSAHYRGHGWNPLAGGDVDVTYVVRNTGNVRLSGRHLARVSGVLQPASARKVERIPELLPGNQVELHSTVDNVRPLFWVTADTTLSPGAVPGDKIPATPVATGKISLWASSWALNIAVLLVLAIAVLVAIRQFRRFRVSPPPATPVPVAEEPAQL